MSKNNNVSDFTTDNIILPKVLYKGELPVGDIVLDCAVLDNNIRILSANSIFAAFARSRKGINSRLEINGTKLPSFIASKNLEPYITQSLLGRTSQIEYVDNDKIKTGYTCTLLISMCEMYLNARRDNILFTSQKKLAIRAEILLMAFANVGIEALIDEATGYQYDRTHDALRILLQKYIAEGLQKWLTKDGKEILIRQLYRILGIMETSENINSFKIKIDKQKTISIAPYLFDDMNKIN